MPIPPTATKATASATHRLGDDLVSYIHTLTHQAFGLIAFRTGAGRLFRDLMLHWPALPEWEDEAYELCQRISEAAYPLLGATFAQSVDVSVTVFDQPLTRSGLASAEPVRRITSCVIFDGNKGVEQCSTLLPGQPIPLPAASFGLIVLCRPLHYRYHTIRDDRKRVGHPHAGIFEISQRLINDLYAQPAFIATEKKILETTLPYTPAH